MPTPHPLTAGEPNPFAITPRTVLMQANPDDPRESEGVLIPRR